MNLLLAYFAGALSGSVLLALALHVKAMIRSPLPPLHGTFEASIARWGAMWARRHD